MIAHTDILKVVRSVMRRSNRLPDRRVMHPAREWIGGLVVALSALAVGAGYATYIFVAQLQQLDRPVSADITVVRYDEDTIERALDLYRERAAWFAALQDERGVLPNSGTLPGGTQSGSEVPAETLELE